LISNFLFFAKRGSEERVFSTSEGEVEDVVRWVMENDEEWGRIHFDFRSWTWMVGIEVGSAESGENSRSRLNLASL
jgi:hypothetical protein